MTFPILSRDRRRSVQQAIASPPTDAATIHAAPGSGALVHQSGGRPAAQDPDIARTLETVAEQLCSPVTLHLGAAPEPSQRHRVLPVSDGEREVGVLVFDAGADEEAVAMAARLLGQRLCALGDVAGHATLTRERVAAVLEPGQLEAHFQPIVALGTGAIVGVESLVRFPRHGGEGPTSWLRAATAAGLRTPLEARAAAVAIEGLASMPEDWFLAVNLSAQVLASGAVTPLLRDVPADRVVVELTEHDAVHDYAALNAVLAPLRARGLRLAVDDVGAGFASMRHVLRTRPDLLKLDREFVRDLTGDRAAESLVGSLRGFAADIGASVIVEGVERAQDEDVVRRLGIELAQGFHFGAPQPLHSLLGDPRSRVAS